jgi:arylsulfate sulfotransferase
MRKLQIIKTLGITLSLTLCMVLFFTNCSNDPIAIDEIEEAKPAPKPTGDFLVACANYRNATRGLIMVYDKAGNVVKQFDAGSTTMDFKKWTLPDGKVRYSFLKYDPTLYHVYNVGYNAGKIVILNENFQEINRLSLLPYGFHTENNNPALDGHDFILLADNHYIGMAYVEKQVSNIPKELTTLPTCGVIAPIIQEVKDGKVIWEWDGTEEPEMYRTSVEGNDYRTGRLTQDYAHINSINIDPKDNNLILSFRNMNQVMKLERYTGKIIWRLGGGNSDFAMTEEQKFLRQHHAHFLADGKTMILFDNGDSKERPYSRVVEFVLDEKNRKITGYKSMYLPDRSFSQYMGSVEKTDSSYFVGLGNDPRVMEINLNTGTKMFEQWLDMASYRAYRY